MEKLKAKHREMFPYIRLFPLEGADRLNHRNYPDLYYAAVSRAIKNKELGPEGQYIMTDSNNHFSQNNNRPREGENI